MGYKLQSVRGNCRRLPCPPRIYAAERGAQPSRSALRDRPRPFRSYERNEGLQGRIAALERELESADAFGPFVSSNLIVDKSEGYAAAVPKLYRVAILIYFARATHLYQGASEKLTQLADEGFAILVELEYCDRLFPVTIIGFEACNDEERLAVMEIIARTKLRRHVNHRLECVSNLLQAFWTQIDMHAEEGSRLDYMETLSSNECVRGYAAVCVKRTLDFSQWFNPELKQDGVNFSGLQLPGRSIVAMATITRLYPRVRFPFVLM